MRVGGLFFLGVLIFGGLALGAELHHREHLRLGQDTLNERLAHDYLQYAMSGIVESQLLMERTLSERDLSGYAPAVHRLDAAVKATAAAREACLSPASRQAAEQTLRGLQAVQKLIAESRDSFTGIFNDRSYGNLQSVREGLVALADAATEAKNAELTLALAQAWAVLGQISPPQGLNFSEENLARAAALGQALAGAGRFAQSGREKEALAESLAACAALEGALGKYSRHLAAVLNVLSLMEQAADGAREALDVAGNLILDALYENEHLEKMHREQALFCLGGAFLLYCAAVLLILRWPGAARPRAGARRAPKAGLDPAAVSGRVVKSRRKP